jgi:hypothetical protein
MEFSTDAKAALDDQVTDIRWLMFLDIVDAPQRVTNSPQPLAFASDVPDVLLAGQTFLRLSTVLSMTMTRGRGGSATFTLSGLQDVDTALLNAIGDKSKWRGRRAALWAAVHDLDTGELLGIKRLGSYFMSPPRFYIDRGQAVISMEAQSLQARLAEPSAATYLDQPKFDADDNSALATLAAASGLKNTRSLGGTQPGPEWWGGFDFNQWNGVF